MKTWRYYLTEKFYKHRLRHRNMPDKERDQYDMDYNEYILPRAKKLHWHIGKVRKGNNRWRIFKKLFIKKWGMFY